MWLWNGAMGAACFLTDPPCTQVTVEFGETHLLVVVRDAEGAEEYRLDLELYGKVRLP